ncbi:MAG TPA: zinc metalloprotease HtpX [Elusimicrobia bacterium]|nr:zinc metalloprotease HtpX [Elusimicrobiota bacterium]HBT60557.1 zinc metalloprotease HtpX [Elusimicrobiota bacterium]
MNTLKITLLMTGMTLLFLAAGRALGGESGMMMAFMMAVGTNFFAYWFSDKMVLMMSGAKEVTRAQAPRLFEMVEELAQRARLPMPRLYVMPEAAPNAFATGRDPRHAAVAVTEGILDMLSPRELQGVLAHELAHIKNRDILVATIAAAMAGAISMLAHMAQWGMMLGGRRHDSDREGGHPIAAIAAMILAPLAAMLIQMAISRSREYLADAKGARIHGNPMDLASALRKMEQAGRRARMDVQPAAAHLFIVNPLRGDGVMSLFSTHPPVRERVKRLEAMAAG